jgi:TrmH family RNA methyltransferase
VFPLSKLGELSPRTRQRKIARILQGIEVDAAAGGTPDPAYLQGLLQQLGRSGLPVVDEAAAALARELSTPPGAGMRRAANGLRHALLAVLGAEPAEWDLVDPSTGELDRSTIVTLPMGVFLEDLRSPFNVGSIVRSAEAFGVERLLLSPRTPAPDHPRARRTSRGADAVLPWQKAELASIAGSEGLFALELGGVPIDRFRFPPRGIVLVGSEELGLSPEALRLADAGLGRVSIPLGGAKRSLNVSVAFGILIHAWRTAISAPRAPLHP